MKGFDYSKIGDSKFYDRCRPIGRVFRKTQYKINYIGVENIPKEGGFILASNHLCALDPAFIGLGIEERQLHFMGKKELFEKAFTRRVLTRLNGFPIVRGGADSEALNYAIRIVKEGHILGIFPEGTRSRDYKPGRAKTGVAVIARAAHGDILPVSVYSCDEMKKHTRLTIRFGKLIPFETLGINDDSTKEELKQCAQNIMGEITELWRLGHCE